MQPSTGFVWILFCIASGYSFDHINMQVYWDTPYVLRGKWFIHLYDQVWCIAENDINTTVSKNLYIIIYLCMTFYVRVSIISKKKSEFSTVPEEFGTYSMYIQVVWFNLSVIFIYTVHMFQLGVARKRILDPFNYDMDPDPSLKLTGTVCPRILVHFHMPSI